MNAWVLNQTIRRIFAFLFILFILNKLIIRPWVLEHSSSELLEILVLSLPNFIEAFMGSTVIAVFLYYFQTKVTLLRSFSPVLLNLLACVLAAIYVITQELKIHNLGGRNVYDPYDLIASILGLLFTFMVFTSVDFVIRNTIEVNDSNDSFKK